MAGILDINMKGTHPGTIPVRFGLIWFSGFRGEESKKSANQKQESPVAAMFVADRDGMSNLYRGPSIDAPTTFRII